MQDTAEGFGQPIRHVFEPFFAHRSASCRRRSTRAALSRHGRRPDLALACTCRSRALVQRIARLRARGCSRGASPLYLLYSFVTLSCCWRSCYDARSGSSPRSLEVLAALAAAPLFVGWINQCRAWLQNQQRAEPAAALSRHSQAVPQGCGDRARTPRRSSASRRTSCSAPWCCAAAIIPVDGDRPAVHPRRRRDRAGRAARAGARLHVARRDGHRHGLRHARRAPRDDGRLPRRAGAADGDLHRVADLAVDLAADDRRDARARRARDLSEPRVRRRRLHHGARSPRTRASRSTIRPRTSSSR